MKISAWAAFGQVVGALCVATLIFGTSPTLGDAWQDDIQFASCECGLADECCAAGDCGDDVCGCGAATCGDCGYCWNGPCLTDGLTKRFTSMAESMAAQGITYAPVPTQFYQGVATGGNEQTFEYGGKLDQFVILDSGKLGLWQGMTTTMHVETRFGDDVNFEAVGLAPVNVAMLYPKTGEHVTAITGLTFAQALNEEVQVTFGKFNALDLFYGLYPQTGRGVNGFMNASIVIPLAVARVTPLSFMGAGALKLHGKQIQGGVLVYDTHNVPTTSGFEELFDNGANILGFWRFFTETGGLPGSHYFGGVGSTGSFFAADPAGFIIIPGQGVVAPRQSGSWALIYILEQTLWADDCNKDRNIGLLSQWCLADEETCPFQWTGNVAVQAQGLNCCRPHDTMGVGYFFTGLSNDFQNLLAPVVELHDVNGVELYYNAAVSKCFQLTADLQVIEPAEVANDTAVVFGLRGSVGM
jgi:porin